MNVKENDDQICCVCDRKADHYCKRCLQPYCTRECQEADWLEHKSTCFPMPRLVKKEISLRPPQPATVALKPNDSQTSVQSTVSTVPTVSIFQNPFKRNSKNIGFATNDLNVLQKLNSPHKSANKEIPSAIKKISERIIKESDKPEGLKKIINSETSRMPAKNPLKTLAAAKPKKASQSNGVDSKIASTELLVPTKEQREQTEPQPQENNTIVTMNDIDIVPIPSGKKLYCSDFTNIEEGYVSACVYNPKAIAHIDKLTAKITDYCQSTNEIYCPQANELCLCRYKEDGQWYRAMVEKVIDSKIFEIEFIDFGNKASVQESDIRKIPEEFMHHCLVNKCYLKDFPENPTKNEILKMAIFFDDNNIFDITNLDEENGRYVIDVEY